MEPIYQRFLIHQNLAKVHKDVDIFTGLAKWKRLIDRANWWSEEKMKKELGDIKGGHWIEAGLLPTGGDRIAGSKERYKLEFACPMTMKK